MRNVAKTVAALVFSVAMIALRAQAPGEPGSAEVRVDQDCRILTQDRADTSDTYSRPRFREDPSMCRIEGQHESQMWDSELVNGVVRRTRVTVREQTYVLHNVFGGPLTFTVGQLVPRGWHVDSIPQPQAMDGQIALFHVQVDAGQTVHLHVGERH